MPRPAEIVDAAARRIAELERALALAEERAITDVLTGLLNRRGWEQLLARETDRARRHHLQGTVLLLDVDDMKAANARGYHEGDELLSRCAAAILAGIRSHDAAARIGGDEFGVLAVHADESSTDILRERLAASLSAAGVSASMGAASLGEGQTLVDACRLADERMLAVKLQRRAS